MATEFSSGRKVRNWEGSRSDSEGEGHKGLFEQPLVVEGKRKRKSTETFAISHLPKKPATKYAGGSGDKLGDIARVEFFLSKHHSDDLKPLHRLCLDRPGSKSEIKKNLRGFNGFAFSKDSEQYQRKKISLEKLTKSGLKPFLLILDLSRSGSKEEQVERILDFLLKPQDSGRAPPRSKKRKRSSSGKKGKGGVKRRKPSTPSSTSEEEEEVEGASGESEEEEEEESEEESEEEEAFSPSDSALLKTVRELMKGADLESVTTNSLMQQVFGRYPGVDLDGRREYIKTCIEGVLSAP